MREFDFSQNEALIDCFTKLRVTTVCHNVQIHLPTSSVMLRVDAFAGKFHSLSRAWAHLRPLWIHLSLQSEAVCASRGLQRPNASQVEFPSFLNSATLAGSTWTAACHGQQAIASRPEENNPAFPVLLAETPKGPGCRLHRSAEHAAEGILSVQCLRALQFLSSTS